MAMAPWTPDLLSLALYTFMVLVLIAVLLFLAEWVGQRRPNRDKSQVYECGIIPTPLGPGSYPVPFYLVAIFFLCFDIEGAFIFSWAAAFAPLGWAGWLRIGFFIIVLLLSLFYLWAKGGLAWGASAHIRPRARKS